MRLLWSFHGQLLFYGHFTLSYADMLNSFWGMKCMQLKLRSFTLLKRLIRKLLFWKFCYTKYNQI